MLLRSRGWKLTKLLSGQTFLNASERAASVTMESGESERDVQVIREGLASVKTAGNVFYNPVQEFNRDLSISVLSSFQKLYHKEKLAKKKEQVPEEVIWTPGVKCDDGITILEALSATGLRSIRYAKEIPGVKSILANDINQKAVESIRMNIKENSVEDLVEASFNDASMLMYERRREQFDAVDLDPYGCPSIFLDGAVQVVKDGGLLLVTATDTAILCGNSPETCYSKYGAVSLKTKACHEMALRILLQSIESHANRYGRYIIPLLSISADFYIRVFVRIFSSPHKCKFTLSKLATVYSCSACDSFNLQPLGILKKNEAKNLVKFALPTDLFNGKECEHCKHPLHMGGPIWAAPLHDREFVSDVINNHPKHLNTSKRIEGVLSVVSEELDDPLYYALERLAGTMHCETPAMLSIRSALLNAGYKVSSTHVNRTSIKTNAPGKIVWDVMRKWVELHPIKSNKRIGGSPVDNILKVEREIDPSFENHPEANPESRKRGCLRYQTNPTPYWGPGTRSTVMIGGDRMSKSRRNQGKRKREDETVESQ